MVLTDVILCGIVRAESRNEAKEVLTSSIDKLINAFPDNSGRPIKILPFKRQYSPVVLKRREVVSVTPFISNSNISPFDELSAEFFFTVILTLESTERAAIEWLLSSGELIPRYPPQFSNITWSSPVPSGGYDRLWKE